MTMTLLDPGQVLKSAYDDATGALKTTPVSGTITTGGTLTDKSGTTSGTPGTSTTLAALNTSRKYFFVQNIDTGGNIFINFTGAASTSSAGSIKLQPGASFVMEGGFVSTELITVTGSAASLKYSAKEG